MGFVGILVLFSKDVARIMTPVPTQVDFWCPVIVSGSKVTNILKCTTSRSYA